MPAQIRDLHAASRARGVHAETDPEAVVHQDNGPYSAVFRGEVRDEGIFNDQMPRVPLAANGVTEVAAFHAKAALEQTAEAASSFGARAGPFQNCALFPLHSQLSHER